MCACSPVEQTQEVLVIQISRQCSEQILARQREFKGKRAKLRKGIFLKMKSSDDGRETSFLMLPETCLDSTSQER